MDNIISIELKDTININNKFTFIVTSLDRKEVYKYCLVRTQNYYFGKLEINPCFNLAIFNALNIKSPNAFVENIVGYATTGSWPEVRSFEDFKKVLNALTNYLEL